MYRPTEKLYLTAFGGGAYGKKFTATDDDVAQVRHAKLAAKGRRVGRGKATLYRRDADGWVRV